MKPLYVFFLMPFYFSIRLPDQFYAIFRSGRYTEIYKRPGLTLEAATHRPYLGESSRRALPDAISLRHDESTS